MNKNLVQTSDQKLWEGEIASAEKELKEWHQKGRRVYAKYLDKRDGATATSRWFNLYNSNVSMLLSSLYNHVPKPDITRRFKDSTDQVGRVASILLERVISYELETFPDFDAAIKDAIKDRLVPGLGTVWQTYEVQSEETEAAEPGIEGQPPQEPTVTSERSPLDFVLWEDFIWSPARSWSEVRWAGRRRYLTKVAATTRFGEEIAEELPYNYEGTYKKDASDASAAKDVESKTALVYEIWDKDSKSVLLVCLECEDVLSKTEDVIGFNGFFPCPPPMLACHSTNNIVPVSDYQLAQDQYEELNSVNQRIAKLVEACKVAGVYDERNGSIKDLLGASNENKLIPVKNWSQFSERGGFKGAVDWLPLEQIIKALQQLYDARDRIKQQLYEVTGLSDILRGATKASETLGAQQIKAGFAGVRLSALQREVSEFVRDTIRLKAEVVCKLYSDDTILQAAGQLQDTDQQLVPQALQMLRTDFLRQYRVDIDVDSITAADWQREKASRIEFLTAVSGFLREAIPAAAAQPDLAELLMTMLKFGVAGFKAGRELEGKIDATLAMLSQKASQPKPPPPPTPEQQEMELKRQESQMRMQESAQKLQFEQQKFQSEMQQNEKEFQQKMSFEERKFKLEMMLDTAKAKADFVATAREGEASRAEERAKHDTSTSLEREKLSMSREEKGLPQQEKNTEVLMELVQGVRQALSELSAAVSETNNSEKEFVLDPATGKPVGVRKKQETK